MSNIFRRLGKALTFGRLEDDVRKALRSALNTPPPAPPSSTTAQETLGVAAAAGAADATAYVRQQPDWCDECGHRVKPEYLQSLFKGTAILFEDGNVSLPHFETVYYCQECKPPAVLRLILRDFSRGEELDDLLYRVKDGWFQLVDEDTGDDRCVVSLEEYNHVFCTDCGELIEETECQRCRTPAAAKQSRRK